MEILLIFLGIIAVIIIVFFVVIPQTKFGKAVDTFIDDNTGETRFQGTITIDKELLL